MRVPVVLLGVAGVALYGSYSHFSAPSGRLAQLAQVSEIVTGGSMSGTMTDASSSLPRVFSPQKPLLSPQAEPQPGTRRVVEQVLPAPPVPVLVTRRSDPFGEAPAIQAVQPKAQPTAAGAPQPAGRKAPGGRPASEEARAALVRDLQRELKRVGCFDGELSGWWNQGTRRAMNAFTERVNASLPVEEPDYILLALVQSHTGQACGSGCPDGQAMASSGPNSGRCLPRAILAQNEKKSGRTDTVAKTQETREGPAESDRRMQQSAAALAGQLAASKTVPRNKGWETGVFPAAPQPSPAIRPAAPAAAPAPVAVAAVPPADPLPGRMSIGAPIASQLEGRIAPPTSTGSLPSAPPPEAVRGTDNWSSSGGTSSYRASPPPKRVARAEYQPAVRAYSPPPPPPKRPRSGASLRNSQGVKDFFFGAGRGSF